MNWNQQKEDELTEMMKNVHHDNCLTWMKGQQDDLVDLTVTSPPYDNLRDYKGYSFDFEPIAKELYRITKPGGVVIWVVGDGTVSGGETGTSFRQALYFRDVCGFTLHDTMIYQKNTSSFPSGAKSNRYTQIFEYMFVLSKGKPKTVNLIVDKPNRWAGWKTWGVATKRQVDGTMITSNFGEKKIRDFGVRNNIWDESIDVAKMIKNILESENVSDSDLVERDDIWEIICSGGFGHSDKLAYQHPATFPEKLAEDHILTWSGPGETVFDPFAGSGTTLLMAYKNNRKYIGCEMSKEYYDLIQERFKNYLNSDHKKLNKSKKVSKSIKTVPVNTQKKKDSSISDIVDVELASKTFEIKEVW